MTIDRPRVLHFDRFANRSAQILAACLFSAFVFVLAGCVGGTTPQRSSGDSGDAVSRILVAPLNMTVVLPDELRSSTEIVHDALIRHLEENGRTVHQLSRPMASRLWTAAVNSVRRTDEERNFETAAEEFARRAAEQFPFDALIIPSLYIQNGKVGPRTVRWDSANQSIQFVGQSRWEIEPPALSTVLAASIHVYGLNPRGEKLHEKRTGLELIQHLEINIQKRQGHDKRTWTLANDDPAIEDAVRVRAAVAHSLSPFISK